MVATYIIDGAIISTVNYDDVELVESADLGAIGQSTITIEDDAGTLDIKGHKTFIATENDCADERTLKGFVSDRTYERGVFETAQGRVIRLSVLDLNDLLAQRLIRGKDGKRPKETIGERIQWLLDRELDGLVADNGRVAYPGKEIDKADTRNSYPGDVLAECAMAAGGFNYYVYLEGSEESLAFWNDGANSSNSSILRLTNVYSDTAASSNTFLVTDEMTLNRSPSQTFSKVIVPFGRGTVAEERAATASNYARRDGQAPNANVKNSERASRIARDFLWEHRNEQDVIEVTVAQMPAAAINLAHAGDRIEARFSHLTTEGYGSFTWFRIVERRLKPLLRDIAPAIYEVSYKLVSQGEAEPQCSYTPTHSGTYYPLGGTVGQDRPNPSDGVVFYLRGGEIYPTYPWVGHVGRWHFPTFSGPTGPDYFASGMGNELRFVIVGNGTLTINTVQWQNQSQPYTVLVQRMVGGAGIMQNFYTGTSGGSTAVVITSAEAPNCTHIVSVRADARLNGSYIGMGWSSAVWVPS